MKGESATKSGIDFIALAIPEVIAILIAGAIANKTGHYVCGFQYPGLGYSGFNASHRSNSWSLVLLSLPLDPASSVGSV